MKNIVQVYSVGSLLDAVRENNDIVVRFNGKDMPLTTQYYIEDECWYGFANESNMANKEMLEKNIIHECYDSCWNDDIYQAPYDRVSGCDFRVCIGHDVDEDKCYEVLHAQYEDNKTILIIEDEDIDEDIEILLNDGCFKN